MCSIDLSLIEAIGSAYLIQFSMIRMMRVAVPSTLGLDGIATSGNPLFSVSRLSATFIHTIKL
ncbi:MAG: hypothetical protein JNL11_13705 [Bdellovibrionaceae bacterium]|nr:hypothetical protein [Pseudobdellovibrionaceae bacterium]